MADREREINCILVETIPYLFGTTPYLLCYNHLLSHPNPPDLAGIDLGKASCRP